MSSLNLNTRKKTSKTKTIIITLLIILLAGFACFVSYDDMETKKKIDKLEADNKDYEEQVEKLKKENRQLTETMEKQKEEALKQKVDNYFVSYSTYMKTPDNLTTLSLKGDNTFSMNINFCSGVGTITGKYTRDDKSKKIVLKEIANLPQGYLGSGTTEINFDILDDGKLKVNNDIGCMSKESLFSKK